MGKTNCNVALLVESSRAYGRNLLRGIALYVRSVAQWSVLHQERTLSEGLPAWLNPDELDGVLARIDSEAMFDQLVKLRIPVVDLRGRFKSPRIPRVLVHDAMVARQAAVHLRQRGLKNFAYCGFSGADYSENRLAGFVTEVRQDAFFDSYMTRRPQDHSSTSQVELHGIEEEKRIGQWLAKLPHPCGVMACNDILGRIVLNACRWENLKVPDRIAVIGVDNDEVLCDLSAPPLSSVNPPCERIGYEAAALLERLMRKEKVTSELLLDPLGVVDRASTAVLVTGDQMVIETLAFIREHYLKNVHVGDILKHLKSVGLTMSRSTMERRFFNILGHTPRDEIQRLRLEKTRELLLGTNLPLNQIATMVGFEHHEYLCAVFKRETGQTPGDYRRQLGRLESVDRLANATASAD